MPDEGFRVRDAALTVDEVAARLGVTVRSVRNWIGAGELPALKFGGRVGYRVLESDLEQFMLARRIGADYLLGLGAPGREPEDERG